MLLPPAVPVYALVLIRTIGITGTPLDLAHIWGGEEGGIILKHLCRSRELSIPVTSYTGLLLDFFLLL